MFPARVLCCVLVGVVCTVSARPHKREDFSQYLANDTLIGEQVPCTDVEKECLRFNRLLHQKSGRCYPMGHGPRDCRFFVDRREFTQGEGNLRGVCLPKQPCESGDFVLAYDGRCVGIRQIKKICSHFRDLEPTFHFFGGTECTKAEFSPSTPKYTKQPEEHGKCVFPNLRHDFTSIRAVEAKLFNLNCAPEQSACFSKGQVWYEPAGSCYPLLESGPCPENHRLVLRTEKKFVVSECVPVNPCKRHQRPMAFDHGKCHDAAFIRMVLCPTGMLLSDAFGHFSCTGIKDMNKHVIVLGSGRPGACEVVHRISHVLDGPGKQVLPDCTLTNWGNCTRAVDDLMRSATIYGRAYNDVIN